MNKLREVREKKGLTQEELAVRAGISRVTINKLENVGASNVTLHTMKAIANALGESVEKIFCDLG